MNARASLPVAGALACIAGAAGCGILGGAAGEVSGQVGLVSIVQRVALLPGVDALDPAGPTAVGMDWRRVVFTFTEPISPDSVAAFNPGCSLVHTGLTLDPA